MTSQAELREIALGAARSYLRRMGIDPATIEPDKALAALDDLYRIDQEVLASIWYGSASDNQIKLFKREFSKWKERQRILG